MRDDTKTEPAETENGPTCRHIISPAVLNFKIFVKHVPRAWVPQECCLRLRNYAANVVWFISMSKDRKSPFRLRNCDSSNSQLWETSVSSQPLCAKITDSVWVLTPQMPLAVGTEIHTCINELQQRVEHVVADLGPWPAYAQFDSKDESKAKEDQLQFWSLHLNEVFQKWCALVKQLWSSIIKASSAAAKMPKASRTNCVGFQRPCPCNPTHFQWGAQLGFLHVMYGKPLGLTLPFATNTSVGRS